MNLNGLKSWLYHGIYYNVIKLLTPMQADSFFFNSFNGSSFSGNPRALFEQLAPRFPQAEFNVILVDPAEADRLRAAYPQTKFNFVQRHERQYFQALARSKYWIMDVNFPHRLKPHRQGVFVQTWHGTPLKKIGNDLPASNQFRQQTKKDALNWDYFLSNAQDDEWIYRSAFDLRTTKILNYGLPRNDALVAQQNNQRLCQRIKAELGIVNQLPCVFYAPTFRDNEPFHLELDLAAFQERFGDRCNLMTRLHPNVADQMPDVTNYPCVVDASHYPDVQSLYLISAILITDYSSVFFDYSLLRRPIIFYPYDLSRYQDVLRGFYYDYTKFVPGPIDQTQAQLYDQLDQTLAGKDGASLQQVREFAQKHNANLQGDATKQVLETIWSRH